MVDKFEKSQIEKFDQHSDEIIHMLEKFETNLKVENM